MVLPELITHSTAERGVKRTTPAFLTVQVPLSVMLIPAVFALALCPPGLVTEVLLIRHPIFPDFLWVLGDVFEVLAFAAMTLCGKFLFENTVVLFEPMTTDAYTVRANSETVDCFALLGLSGPCDINSAFNRLLSMESLVIHHFLST